MDIKDKVVEIISNQMNIDVHGIYLSDTLYELHIDSLDMVEICIALESEFKVVFTDDEVLDMFLKITYVRDVVKLTQSKISEG